MPFSKKHKIQSRRRQVSLLYLKGKSQPEIAEAIGVTQQQVSHDLKKLREEWKKEMVSNIDEAKARELAKVDQLEREYWQAWEKSVENYKQKMVKAKGTQEGPHDNAKIKTSHIEKTEKEMIVFGDPRFLQGVQWCIERRCKILGIDAPEKKELSGKDGKDLFERMTEDELDRKIKEALTVINAGSG